MSKEIQQIIAKLETLKTGERAILATVVDVEGSGYRRPGARMLIDGEGRSVGTVSGGCLEADVLERARQVLATDEPAVITYDTTRDENSLFGLGMGCRGIVRILLEPIGAETVIGRTLLTAVREPFRGTMIGTVISAERAALGGRIFYSPDDKFDFENAPKSFTDERELLDYCERFYRQKAAPEVRRVEIDGDEIELFFENIAPPLNLLLFGAGFDALPLARFAKELGWRVTAIDHRPAYADRARLPEADEIIAASIEEVNDFYFRDDNAVAVVMTHNYERDREILRRLMRSECRYIGALGPKKRTERLLAEIGETDNIRQTERLHAPVGLDIGAQTPEAIALAIVAEIQSVLSGRRGGFLREREGSIYDR